ncbi:MAG: D-glycero-beta-D-manno-heptose-7-phosphate kinase [Alphaproteobacteria bacterium]|nr:D-glycero-beta-D-manno-heptose-7-phosphate kinase [Alphaproteobacteria bacterium]
MSQSLAHHVEAMKQASVLVIGDIMLDRFVYGSVDRISPESPVPVLAVARENFMLGGAGNTLANIVGLGAKGLIISVTGEDEDGRVIRERAEALGIDTSGLLYDKARPTTVKTRYLAGHQQVLRTDFEDKTPVTDALAAQLIEKAEQLIAQVQAVIISDYGKGVLRRDVIAAVIAAANKRGVPVVVDPKGRDFSIYKGASAVTPNRKELSEAAHGLPVKTDTEVMEAAQDIIKRCGIETVIATRSADGMSIISGEAPPVHLRTRNIEVFDVSGAGDTVIATIATALAAGASMPEAGALANLAGSLVVAKVGTASIRANELLDAVNSDHGDALAGHLSLGGSSSGGGAHMARLLESEEAAEQVRRWKARGLKVGFTNGCFDILHYGHVSYLNNTRNHCDRLIVALNKDSSVKILKGETRPVHDEASRAAVLGALGCVDMVVLFGAHTVGEDNTATALLKHLQPDIYFKGGDYTEDQIPEAPTVRAYGGEVCVMPVYEGHSTTGSIKKMTEDKAA